MNKSGGDFKMSEVDEQFERINKIVGNDEWMAEEQIDIFYNHLKDSLRLPFEVTGIEDFGWEEFYIVGPGSKEEHEALRRNQPSYKDIYKLIEIKNRVTSEWMLYSPEIGARVRRKSDRKVFWLGLSELKAMDEGSKNYQLLDDYAVWYANRYC